MNEIEKGIEVLSNRDPILRDIIIKIGECKLTTQDDLFKCLVKSIIDQQLSVSASSAIHKRVDEHFRLNYLPKKILQTNPSDLNKLGISRKKIIYLYDLSNKIISMDLDLHSLNEHDNQTVINKLCEVKGIGVWTSKMFLIFVLGRMNVFPTEDLVFKKQLFTHYNIEPNHLDSLNRIQALWSPYESIAAWYLWRYKDSK